MDSLTKILLLEQGQFALALCIVLNLLWLASWAVTVAKHFYGEKFTRTKRRYKNQSKFKTILYCRHKANPWRDSIPEMMDYTMIIYNLIISVLFATFLVADFLFKN
jgi:hypothetical protein